MDDLRLSVAEPDVGSVAAAAIEYAAVTEKVALAVARLEGAGDPERAYTIAAEAFKQELDKVPISGQIAIVREERVGERGQVRARRQHASGLSVGGELGSGGVEVDLAVEPVEGIHLLAQGQEGSVSAIAVAPRGGMLRIPDMYMKKIIAGPLAKGKIDIDASVAENIGAIAEAMDRKPTEITVAVLDRERHEDLIAEIRRTGARIRIRPEGDLTPAIAVGMRGSDLHAVMGIGGAPEGVLAAAVIKCLGGEMQAKMWPTQRRQVEMLEKYGLDDPEQKLTLDDLVRGDEIVFAATGITEGEPLRGVRYFRGGGRTHTVVISTKPRMIRFIDAIHVLEQGTEVRGYQF